MKAEYAQYLINKTKSNYNRIATDFSNKRSYLSNDIIVLAEYLRPKDKLLDLGCGNGRLFELTQGKDVSYTGVDISQALISIAEAKYPAAHFLLIDPLKLPFPNGSFDVIFCLAVYHHLPGQEMRRQFLSEAKRVLEPGGKIILTVWNLAGKKEITSQLNRLRFKRFLHLTKLGTGDVLWPFKNSQGAVIVNRYLHVFTSTELKSDFQAVGLKTIKATELARGVKAENKNLLIVGQK